MEAIDGQPAAEAAARVRAGIRQVRVSLPARSLLPLVARPRHPAAPPRRRVTPWPRARRTSCSRRSLADPLARRHLARLVRREDHRVGLGGDLHAGLDGHEVLDSMWLAPAPIFWDWSGDRALCRTAAGRTAARIMQMVLTAERSLATRPARGGCSGAVSGRGRARSTAHQRTVRASSASALAR